MSNDDVVDLTASFTLANHSSLSNEIIIVDSDESFEVGNRNEKKLSSKIIEKQKSTLKRSSRTVKLKENNFECPICYAEFGINPLVSTKCGHAFCLKCLQQSLKIVKKCPTCRRALKKNSEYHPLYLSKD